MFQLLQKKADKEKKTQQIRNVTENIQQEIDLNLIKSIITLNIDIQLHNTVKS